MDDNDVQTNATENVIVVDAQTQDQENVKDR